MQLSVESTTSKGRSMLRPYEYETMFLFNFSNLIATLGIRESYHPLHVSPPSTGRVTPLTYLASSDAR